jgi:hypothetical protein
MSTERDEPISDETTERLAKMIVNARHLVRFTGAKRKRYLTATHKL